MSEQREDRRGFVTPVEYREVGLDSGTLKGFRDVQ
jgi:hypothetical protein